jgi:YidC/Oxa1 family membrane protein insertase
MLGNLFISFIYQPFFNLLVGIYWLITQIPYFPYKDMGVAVIIFTIAIRILLLPTSIRASRTEKERFEIEEKIKETKAKYTAEPILQKQAMKTIFKDKPAILAAEGFNLFIQIVIALMLWKVFATGLVGEDIHLLYSFMPHPPVPYNLSFLGIYDLSHPHVVLNIIQSIVIFVLEATHLMTSPFPVSRKDIIRLQVFLPIVSYIIFSFLPAGKKLFVITTLIFSIIFTILRYSYHFLNRTFNTPKPVNEQPVVPILVASEEKQE